MQKGLITFVTTIYRRFEGVYETLESLFEQDYPDIEVILADDGSPNWAEEEEKLRAFAEARRGPNIRRIVYRHLEENRGTVINSAEAYRIAEGEYIKDLAPEDVLASPHALSRYKELLDESGCLIGFSRIEGRTLEGKTVRHLASSAEDYDVLRTLSPLELRNRLFTRNCLPAPAWFARRELFERYGFYTDVTRLIEDYPYWIHLCNENVRMAFWDEVLVYYRLSGSGMGSYSEAFMRDVYAIYDRCIFPEDRRFGALQPLYNALKKAGLNAYMDRARWEDYSAGQKALALLKRGPFFAYIRLGEMRMDRKNSETGGS